MGRSARLDRRRLLLAGLGAALLPALGVFATASGGATGAASPSPDRCGSYTVQLAENGSPPPFNNLVVQDSFPNVDIETWGHKPFQNPPEVAPTDRNKPYVLNVEYTDPSKTAIDGCPVKLRSYNGQLVGPTLRARPGDTLFITLNNLLPKENAAQTGADQLQEVSQARVGMAPNAFNVTNLHTHGLHVSPGGTCAKSSDNVLLTIQPGVTCHYVIHIPPDHPAGTFWYHAHAHGSTAVQVGSGMEGALIIEDTKPIPAALRAASEPAHEKIFVIQTIPYEPSEDANGHPGKGPGEVVPAYNPNSFQDFFPSVWEGQTTVDGQLVPRVTIRPGEVQRWRFIDAAFRASIHLELRNAAGQPQALHEIALDGLYTGAIDTWGTNTVRPGYIDLEPGYRSDVLFQANVPPGTYDLVDAASDAANSLLGVPELKGVLAEVMVGGAPVSPAMSLPTEAEMKPLAYRPGVLLKKQATGLQKVDFAIGDPLPTDVRNSFTVDDKAFDDMDMKSIRYLKLGATDRWALTSDPKVQAAAPHVFHIHVNPFQYQRRDPNGNLQWVWKDTLLINPGTVKQPGTVNVYSQYTDFTGKFVLHCHILDHEDLGMMQVVDVVKTLPRPIAKMRR
jgi:FtsP/CotA-like multicopper oxidase with cupredoxin domain